MIDSLIVWLLAIDDVIDQPNKVQVWSLAFWKTLNCFICQILIEADQNKRKKTIINVKLDMGRTRVTSKCERETTAWFKSMLGPCVQRCQKAGRHKKTTCLSSISHNSLLMLMLIMEVINIVLRSLANYSIILSGYVGKDIFFFFKVVCVLQNIYRNKNFIKK